VLTAIGLVGTAIGVSLSRKSMDLAALQLEQTRTANEAATMAAIQALEQAREQYNRYLLNEAHAHMETIKAHVTTARWDFVVMRLGDLANVLTHLGIGDGKLADLAVSVRRMEISFGRVVTAEITFDSFKSKWEKLAGEISAQIAVRSAPFTRPNQEDEHD